MPLKSLSLEKLKAKQVRWLAGLALLSLVVFLLIRDLDWASVIQALKQANYRWVALGLLGIVATFFSRVWRWQALLGSPHPPFGATLTAILLGQTLNLFLPARGGDLARSLWAGQHQQISGSAVQVLGTVVLEKLADLLALLCCTAVLLLRMTLPEWFIHSAGGVLLMVLLGIGPLWLGLRWRKHLLSWVATLLARLPRGWDRALLLRLNQLMDGLESIRQPGAWQRLALWTAVNWILGAAVNWAVLQAFHLSLPTAALLLLVLLMAGSSLPVPANLGVFEGICVLGLSLWQVPRDLGLAVGLVLHLVVLAPPLVTVAGLVLWETWMEKYHATP